MIGHNPQISISDLTTHPTNRRQGKLAAENLERIIQSRTVRLNLDSLPYALGSMTDPPDSAIGQINSNPQAMTPNFLHGLTGYIIRKQLLDQVIFSSANPHARKQIALLAAQHHDGTGLAATVPTAGLEIGNI